MGGISQTSSKRRIKEMKRAMLENEHSKFNTYVFILYVRLRSLMRNILNLVNPDLKSKIISKF